jgi:MoaA/NifB/PqqE/SkfB family radical SAM enzyme
MEKSDLKSRDRVAKQKRQWVRITRVCNNRCLFCLDQENQNGGVVPMKEILQALNNGILEGATRAIISGGEPTIHPRIAWIIREAKKMGYKHVQIISNGRMLAYDNFAKKMKEAGLDEITFSLHSHLENKLEEMTGVKGSYKQAMRGLMNALKYGFIVSIDVVINKINYKTLEDTLKFFIKLGVYEFDLLYLVPFGSAWENKNKLFLATLKVKKYLDPVFNLASDSRLHIWTNRMPATLLEGYENLIQNPNKLKDDVGGMEREFKNYITSGKIMSCYGERCQYCFKQKFCLDLMELRERGWLGSLSGPFCLENKKNKKKNIKFKNNLDIFKFLDFYIKNRYFVKSIRCKKCKFDKKCNGLWIEDVRKKGFSILKP